MPVMKNMGANETMMAKVERITGGSTSLTA